jgi:hypothetical protein
MNLKILAPLSRSGRGVGGEGLKALSANQGLKTVLIDLLYRPFLSFPVSRFDAELKQNG